MSRDEYLSGTDQTVSDIVAAASFLWERARSDHFVPVRGRTDPSVEDRRMERWCQIAAQGDREALCTRVRWEGVALATIRPRLGTVSYSGPPPRWSHTLRQIFRAAAARGSTCRRDKRADGGADGSEVSPDEALLLPAVLVARRALRRRVDSLPLSPCSLVAESAYRCLESDLVHRLADLCRQVVEYELSGQSSFGTKLLNVLEWQTPGNFPHGSSSAAMNRLLHDGIGSLLGRYPVLARLVATAVEFWVESTAEFLERLVRDAAAIQETFHGATPPPPCDPVVHITAGLSDPHQRGRTVLSLRFASGGRVVYKPRGLGLESAFNDLVEWCRQRDPALDLQTMRILDRQDYGWEEYVAHDECADEAAVARFYRRTGMLLCLIHVLRGTDCHHDNLIANGEHPVLVDHETLLHHQAHSGEDADQQFETAASQYVNNSVYRTGMLPRWEYSENGRSAYDASGLGSTVGGGGGGAQPPEGTSLPRLHGSRFPADDFQEEIVTGFRRMYRFLADRSEALQAPDAPLAGFGAAANRYIFRPTRIYGVLRQRCLAPDCLRDGVDFSLELEWLSSAFLGSTERPRSWPVLRAELNAMAQLDIPIFRARVDQDDLPIGDGTVIRQYFRESSFDRVHAQLQGLDEEDLARQVRLIGDAFHARNARSAATRSDRRGRVPVPRLDANDWARESTVLADALASTALPNADGSLSWIGFGYEPRADRFRVQALDDGLYDGQTGVALFLAAQYLISGVPRYRSAALRALHSLRERIHAMGPGARRRTAQVVGIGGGSGVGAMIYALVRIGQFLGEDTLPEARALAEWISPELVRADRRLDVLGGAAGALLGLLALHRATGDPAVLATAVVCGHHLLDRRVSHQGSPRAWRTLGTTPLTGFSHGAAGISAALLRLYAITGQLPFRDGALEGIAYEASVFSPDQGGWPDLRETGSRTLPRCLDQWCHGAAGIGLSRLAGLAVVETPDIVRDIEVALATVQRDALHAVDHLCCGNLGRVDVLLAGARQLGRRDWQESATELAGTVVTRARRTGAYRLFANVPASVSNPGFFQGAAGIGYELLRLAHPESLPSVLSWE